MTMLPTTSLIRPGRPANAELAAKNATLREALARPVDPRHPERGSQFEAYYPQLNALPAFAHPPGHARAGKPGRRLRQWWGGGHRIVLNAEELAAAWAWLLPQ